MNAKSKVVGGLAVLLAVAAGVAMLPLKRKGGRKRRKAEEKVSGDIGLLDTEKNYMIVVTKDGKLVTIDYTQKTKVTELKETPRQDGGYRSWVFGGSGVYHKGRKKLSSKIEFTPAKGE